jgi:hypothetical protein
MNYIPEKFGENPINSNEMAANFVKSKMMAAAIFNFDNNLPACLAVFWHMTFCIIV